MYGEYYTIVSASAGFWEKLLIKQIGEELSCRIGKESIGELKIISDTGPALEEIIRLSLVYPSEIFKIKIVREDIYENYVYHYQCSSGQSKLIKEGYEYCFGINKIDKDLLPAGLFKKFMNTATEIYLKLEQDNQDKLGSESIPIPDKKISGECRNSDFNDEPQGTGIRNLKEETLDNITVQVRYETPQVSLTARKLGRTFIDVKVELNERDKDKVKDNKQNSGYQTDFDDLPFYK